MNKERISRLVIDRKVGDSFVVGENIEIRIDEIRGQYARVSIKAPVSVSITRKELITSKMET